VSRSLGAVPAVPGEAPLLGSYRPFLRDPIGFLTRGAEIGPLCTFTFLGRRRVALFAPELVRELMVGVAQHTEETSIFGMGAPREIAGNGILTSEGAERAQHRRAIAAAFQGRLLDGYQRAFAERAAGAVTAWRGAGEVEVVQAVAALVERAALWLFFGLSGRPEEEPVVGAVRLLASLLGGSIDLVVSSKVPFDLPAVSRGGAARRALRVLDDWLRSPAAGSDGGSGDRSFAGAMLEAADPRRPGELEAVRSDLLQLYYAGHETTAAATAWALYLLGKHPAEAELVHEELAGVLGDRDLVLAELEDGLPRLDRAVKESLRLYPPGLYGVRRSTRDVEVGGFAFPAGTVFVTSPWITHRESGVFPDPEAFLPSRFDDAERQIPRGAYFPFGLGPYSCPGAALARMEVKTVVALVLRDHRLELAPGQDVRAVATPIPRPAPGVRAVLRPRVGRAGPATPAPAP